MGVCSLLKTLRECLMCSQYSPVVGGGIAQMNRAEDTINAAWMISLQWSGEGEASVLFAAQPRRRKKREYSQTVTTEAQPWNHRWARKEPEGAYVGVPAREGDQRPITAHWQEPSCRDKDTWDFFSFAFCKWPAHIHTYSAELNTGFSCIGRLRARYVGLP